MLIDESILMRAEKAAQWDLCDHCLGRVFAHVSTGMSNAQRGVEVRSAMNAARSESGDAPYVHSSS